MGGLSVRTKEPWSNDAWTWRVGPTKLAPNPPPPPPSAKGSRRGKQPEVELVESSSLSESSFDGSLQSDGEREEPVWREPQGGGPALSEPECGNQERPRRKISEIINMG